jgi:hypothetical protein
MGILIKAPTRRNEPSVTIAESRDVSSEGRGNAHIREETLGGPRREQLYMWQRRYGFPAAARCVGDRVYPADQVAGR